ATESERVSYATNRDITKGVYECVCLCVCVCVCLIVCVC
ncbi:unnamed protein product, partial [marine sediment metagenome]